MILTALALPSLFIVLSARPFGTRIDGIRTYIVVAASPSTWYTTDRQRIHVAACGILPKRPAEDQGRHLELDVSRP
jgi:hypothetical protein